MADDDPAPRLALPGGLWHGGTSHGVDLPADWRVDVHRMRGADHPALTDADVVRALEAPIGAPPLRDLARGRRKAVVLFDDLTRPTPTWRIAPAVVAALLDAGLHEDRIAFVCALGAHAPLSGGDLRKKLGPAVVERFRVYNHHCWEHGVSVGATSRGTPLWINREVMSADLKIGIGGVTPHSNAGFSGGGKIVLPGVARIDSIRHFHLALPATAPQTVGFGRYDANVMRLDAEEAARRVGLDFKIDVVFNERAEPAAIFAGDLVASHRAAANASRKANALRRGPRPPDVAIVNALAKPNEIVVAFMIGLQALAPRHRGTIVVVADTPDGQVVHYLLSRFGEGYGGARWPSARVPDGVRVVVQAPHHDRTFGDWFAAPEAITFTRDWAATLAALRRWHGPGTEAVVIPEGTIAWYPTPA